MLKLVKFSLNELNLAKIPINKATTAAVYGILAKFNVKIAKFNVKIAKFNLNRLKIR